MDSFFRHMDFRQVIRDLVEEKKKTEPDFNYSHLAKIMGVQRTYLSRVMSGNGYLNSDQIFLLTDHFALSHREHEFLLLLIDFERTGVARRKKVLQQQIAAIQLESRSPKRAMKAEFIESEGHGPTADYYLDPFMTVIHLCLMVPKFNGDALAVARRLGLSDEHTRKILQTLVQLGAIEILASGKGYRVVKDYMQLSPESPLNSANYSLVRLASAQQLMKISRQRRAIYSMTFSADEKTKGLIHEAFLKLLREIETPIREAPSEDVYQMNFDLFPWLV